MPENILSYFMIIGIYGPIVFKEWALKTTSAGLSFTPPGRTPSVRLKWSPESPPQASTKSLLESGLICSLLKSRTLENQLLGVICSAIFEIGSEKDLKHVDDKRTELYKKNSI